MSAFANGQFHTFGNMSGSEGADHAGQSLAEAGRASVDSSGDIITMLEDGTITGAFIFQKYPVRTPAAPQIGPDQDVEVSQNNMEPFEFLCEVPGGCPQQWQKHMAERRRAVSDLFGRNKKCTSGLPRLISVCRMHYQTNSYSEHWGEKRIAFALDQLQRNDEDIPGLLYTIVVKDGEAQRLLNYLDGAPDPADVNIRRRRGRPLRSDLQILRSVLRRWVGRDKTKLDCYGLLMWCYNLLEKHVIEQIPAIEMLPQLEDEEFRINLGRCQKRLLCQAVKETDGNGALRDIQQDFEELQSQHVEAELKFESLEDSALYNAPLGTIDTAMSSDATIEQDSRQPNHISIDPALDTAIANTQRALPSASTPPPPSLLPSPPAAAAASNEASAPAPAPAMLQALEASIDAAIALSTGLDAHTELRHELVALMRQAKARLGAARRRGGGACRVGRAARRPTRRW